MTSKALVKRKKSVVLPQEPDDWTPAQAQDLFDRVVGAVRLQGYVRSEGAVEACCYRNEDGLRCFVGHLITDSEYSEKIEGATVRLLAESGVAFTDLTQASLDFLEELQAIHDDVPPNEWETAFADLAADYGLDYSPPKGRN